MLFSTCPLLWRWRLEGAALALAAYTLLLVPFTLVQEARIAWVAWPASVSEGLAAWQGLSARLAPWSSMAIAPSDTMSAAERAIVSVAPEDIPARLDAMGETFLALAARAEGFRATAYRDAAGWNIGFGYCISCRVGSSSSMVREELAGAWLRPSEIDALVAGPNAIRRKVEITPVQALRLLHIVGVKARAAARASVGASFDVLPSHRQAVLTWLAYNTGAGGFSKFTSLHDAVRRNDTLVAVAELTPWYRTSAGRLKPNLRAGALLKDVYASGAPATVSPAAINAVRSAPQ